jgi:hypothetical protein
MGIEPTAADELRQHLVPARPGTCIAIVGSRNFADLDRVRRFVRELPGDVTVLSGGARGVDRCAVVTARARGLRTLEFLANWERDGRYHAGRRRNERVAQRCDRMVAFWDGRSTGTQDAFRRALRLGRQVVVYRLRLTALVGTLAGRPRIEATGGTPRTEFDLTVNRLGSGGGEISTAYRLKASGETAQTLAELRTGTELRVRAALRQIFVATPGGRLEPRPVHGEALALKRLGKKRTR